jgi:hypothetical protein
MIVTRNMLKAVIAISIAFVMSVASLSAGLLRLSRFPRGTATPSSPIYLALPSAGHRQPSQPLISKYEKIRDLIAEDDRLKPEDPFGVESSTRSIRSISSGRW